MKVFCSILCLCLAVVELGYSIISTQIEIVQSDDLELNRLGRKGR